MLADQNSRSWCNAGFFFFGCGWDSYLIRRWRSVVGVLLFGHNPAKLEELADYVYKTELQLTSADAS